MLDTSWGPTKIRCSVMSRLWAVKVPAAWSGHIRWWIAEVAERGPCDGKIIEAFLAIEARHGIKFLWEYDHPETGRECMGTHEVRQEYRAWLFQLARLKAGRGPGRHYAAKRAA